MAHLKPLLTLFLTILMGACAKPRPMERVLPEARRVPKEALQGTFIFLKSVAEVRSPSKKYRSYIPGMHLDSDRLIQFKQHEDQVDIVSIDPVLEPETAAAKNVLLASFPADHVDVQRKRNSNNELTHEEEETKTERPWAQRAFVRLDLTQDSIDEHSEEIVARSLVIPLEMDLTRGALNFAVQNTLTDGTTLVLHYSFLKYQPSSTYEQRPFSAFDQHRFGLYKTTTFRFDAFDQITDSTRTEFMNRWDTTRTIPFYLSSTVPQHLKPTIRRLFNEWAELLKSAVGDVSVELHESRGQRLGDLRFNTIHYDASEHSAHGALGYAPLVSNPRTGEILKADVILFSKVLKRSAFQELFWDASRARPLGDLPKASDDPYSAPIASLTRTARADLEHRLTRLNEEVVQQVLTANRLQQPWQLVEERILGGVFGHEFGHCLGLSHNPLASADPVHKKVGHTSTSIMDYAFLNGQSARIGPYDAAALLFAYSPDDSVRQQQLERGFYYCSDTEVFSSRNPLCQQYDSASTLTELVENQLDRYLSSYQVNNQRLERVDFPSDDAAYEKRVLSYLLPIRQVYDNAHALHQASAKRDYVALWRLAGARLESTYPDSEDIEVTIPQTPQLAMEGGIPSQRASGFQVTLDRSRLDRVLDDATRSKATAVEALRRIVLDTQRPAFDETDPLTNRVTVRGVLKDRLLALTLLALPMDHPITQGSVISPYSVEERVVPALFASILSNTMKIPDPEELDRAYFRIRRFEMPLRRSALELLSKKVASVDGHAEALNLIQVQPLGLKGAPREASLTRSLETRTLLRNGYRDSLFDRLVPDQPDNGPEFHSDRLTGFLTDLSPFDKTRNDHPMAFAQLGDDTLLGAPVWLEDEKLFTASGLLIRNNLNVAEDYLTTLTAVMREAGPQLFAQPNATGSRFAAMPLLEEQAARLRNHVAVEQLFLQEIYSAFSRRP